MVNITVNLKIKRDNNYALRIFHRFQLFHLPAKKSVEMVLEDYANYKKSKGNSDNK